jgi:cytochrome c556
MMTLQIGPAANLLGRTFLFLERTEPMTRWTFATTLVVVLGASVLAAQSDDKTPTIEQIMEKLHKGGSSQLAKLKTALKASSPNWKNIQKSTKLFAEFGAGLPKNKAPKGDQADFEKLAEAYAASAKALDEAAKQEDLATVKSEFRKIATSCKACHNAHKED